MEYCIFFAWEAGWTTRSICQFYRPGFAREALAPLAPYGACSLRGILVRLRAAKRASENLEVASLVPELVLPRNPAPRARTDRQPRPTLRLG